MREKIRNTPEVPDHEVLRKIGGGSYGEVWMARTITGVMRAIKFVWREDFDNDKDFEREFEGIHHYEPISRNHPGLIPILHVGRSIQEGEAFYYHVMELADDMHDGQSFNPVEYTPRTLRSDLKEADGTPIDVDFCLEVGIKMGQALQYLHDQGLAHRDIKPANFVYYKGAPKLADIGLVAMPGQRTFVGTEGFVPPEGPGTRRADIYSLGKVLYEMSTGMDRLDFPNLPDYDFRPDKAKRWKQLNTLICDVCDPRSDERSVKRATELIDALERISVGKKLKRKTPKAVKVAFLLAPLLAVAGVVLTKVLERTTVEEILSANPLTKKLAPVKVTSTPSEAEVWTLDGEFLGTTPLGGREGEVGTYLQYEFRLDGYSRILAGSKVQAEGVVIEANLPLYAPPESDEIWTDALGMSYDPVEEGHLSDSYLTPWAINRYLAREKIEGFHWERGEALINNTHRQVAVVPRHGGWLYCNWLTEVSIAGGYLTDDYQIVPVFDEKLGLGKLQDKAKKHKLFPLKCKVEKVPFGSITIVSQPRAKLTAYLNEEKVDLSSLNGSLSIMRVKPGKVSLQVEAEGFRTIMQEVEVLAGEHKTITLNLNRNKSVTFDKSWRNSLELEFAPFSESLLVGVTEVPRQAYEAFVTAAGHRRPENPEFGQSPSHPVVFVSRQDAEMFCRWLTEKERGEFLISEQHLYRLPTDLEWSNLCGLRNEEGSTPSARDVSDDGSYYWGSDWKPQDGFGNFADYTAGLAIDMSVSRTISGYQDGVAYTAPVRSFAPSSRGVYDLAGNVSEWVADDFGVGDYGVTRGGNWKSYQEATLCRKFRNAVKPELSNEVTGFRIVLSKVE